MPAMSILSLTLNFCPISLSLGTQYSTILLNYMEDKHEKHEMNSTEDKNATYKHPITVSHQVEVSVLCCSIFGWHLLDMSFFDELICWVNYVLFSSKPLIHLQKFVHLLLKTLSNSRMSKDKKALEGIDRWSYKPNSTRGGYFVMN